MLKSSRCRQDASHFAKSLVLLLIFFLTPFVPASFSASPTQGFNSPYFSSAASDDALSIGFNPAGLGWQKRSQSYFMHSYTDSSLDGNTGIFLSSGGLGFSAEWLGFEMPKGYRKYTIASGWKIMDQLYMGAAYSWFGSKVKEYDHLSSWKIGLLARPHPFVSIGAVATDLNHPKFLGKKTDISYDLGLALRPLTDRVTLSADAFWKEKDKFKDFKLRYKAEIEPLDGFVFSGDVDNDGNFGVNFRVNFPKAAVGVYHYFNKDDDLIQGVSYLNLSGDRYRSWLQRKNNFLVLKLSGEIKEEPKRASFFGPKKKSLLEIVNLIQEAKKDRTIKGMILRIDPLEIGWAKLQEIREGILDFKEEGKKVLCFVEMGGNKEYYLASAADKIVMFPTGYLDLSGMSAEVTFIKKTLEKLGIKAELEHIGDYKTASDLVTREKMSEAHKEEVNSLLDDLYEQMTNDISKSRGLSSKELKDKIDSGPFTASEAFNAKLVDTLEYYDNMEKIAEKMIAQKPHKVDYKEYSQRSYYKYSWSIPPKIAVIFASGFINSGESGDNFLLGKVMGSETIAEAIKKAREDKSIKAIIFRVDSRGGSGLASDVIWREIKNTKGKKPFIVSMSDVAGSGGYWISCAADTILAMPATYTGSIGAISGKLDLSGLYNKIGFTHETIKRGKYADLYTSFRGFTPEERDIVKRQLKEGYDDFVHKVAEGRKMKDASVDSIAQGRVWTGKQGKMNGLVDELGGLKLAIEIAKKKAGIAEDQQIEIVTLPKDRFTLSIPMMGFLTSSNELKLTLEQIEELEKLNQQGILYVMPYSVEVR
jgi:protease IV